MADREELPGGIEWFCPIHPHIRADPQLLQVGENLPAVLEPRSRCPYTNGFTGYFRRLAEMTMDKSLRIDRSLIRARSVLSRAERIDRLETQDRWQEGDSPFGLSKVRVYKMSVKEEEEEGGGRRKGKAGAEGAAAPAATDKKSEKKPDKKADKK